MKLTRGATFGILDDRSFYFTATCSRDAAILARGHEGRAVPHTDCINPLALRPWLGDLTVLHAERDGLRFFISLVGTRIADYVGKRRTGISVSDCVSDPEGSFALKVLETCLDERRPTFAQLPPRSIDAIHNWIDVLVLPFSEDGTTTDRLFGLDGSDTGG